MKRDKIEKKLLILFILLMFYQAACTNKIMKLRDEVNTIAYGLNQEFTALQEAVLKNDQFVENLFKNQSGYKLEIEYMDVAEGGRYKYFDNIQYYNPVDDGNPVVLATGFVPVDDTVKRKIKLLEYAFPSLISTKDESISITTTWIQTKDSIAVGYPFMDIISQVQARLDLSSTLWYQLVVEDVNPQRDPVWVQEPFIGIVGQGWLMTCVSPIYHDNSMEGIATADMVLDPVINKYLSNSSQILLLISAETILVGASGLAKKILNPQLLESPFYLKQGDSIQFAGSDLKLVNSKIEGFKELGELVKGKNEFSILIENTKYSVIVKEIPEVGFFLIGLCRN